MMLLNNVRMRDKERQALADDVERFLAEGGQIQQLETRHWGEDAISDWRKQGEASYRCREAIKADKRVNIGPTWEGE